MDPVQDAMGALAEVIADAVIAGLSKSVDAHDKSRTTGRCWRDGAAMQALLGPKLRKVADDMIGEVGRRTEPRYASYLLHPRYGREQLIDEAEDADATFGKALQAVQQTPGVSELFAFAVAALRVQAVTKAVGAACVYPVHEKEVAGRTGPRQRRREINAADVPAEVADILLASSEIGDPAVAVAELRALERSPANAAPAALVTKIVALLGR